MIRRLALLALVGLFAACAPAEDDSEGPVEDDLPRVTSTTDEPVTTTTPPAPEVIEEPPPETAPPVTQGFRSAPPPSSDCDPSYPDFCIPSPPPDLDCGDIDGKRFTVRPPDPHGFDREGDGIGCES